MGELTAYVHGCGLVHSLVWLLKGTPNGPLHCDHGAGDMVTQLDFERTVVNLSPDPIFAVVVHNAMTSPIYRS